MNNTFNHLINGKPKIAILIDPEKNTDAPAFSARLQNYIAGCPDLFLIGGSTATRHQTEQCIERIKKVSNLPIVLFPGSSEQFSSNAHGVLYLNFISSRNPKYLIEEQINSAEEIYTSGIDCISTGYLLIDGGTRTSTARVTQSTPMSQQDVSYIYSTALAGCLMGHSAIYLDAGSGATHPVSEAIITEIAAIAKLLIVGGGIRTVPSIQKAHAAGAKIVVIGNHLEENPSFAQEIAAYQQQFQAH